MKELRCGDTLLSLNIGNFHRRGTEQVLTPVVVRKIGRKYFEASPEGFNRVTTKYRLEDWVQVTEYSPTSKLYASRQDWENEKEHRELWDAIRLAFNGGGKPSLPLEKLRQIQSIILAK